MSYIHEALKKAQVERDLGKGSHSGIPVPRRGKSFFTAKKTILPAVSVLMVLLAFGAYSWWDLKAEKQNGAPPPAVNPPKVKRVTPAPRDTAGKPLPRTLTGSKSVSREDIAVSYQKARDLHRDGRLPDAGLWYEKVISMDPGHVEALNNRGVLHLHHKDYQAARKCFEKAIRLKPDYVDPYYNLACVSAAKGQVEQGLRYLEKAILMDPQVREWARKDPDLDPLRESRRFLEIVRKNEN